MDFAKIEGHTRVFGKPQNWNEDSGECVDLYVKDVKFPDSNVMVSEWKPTPEEIALLIQGGSLYLWIYGTVHPPVAMTVEHIQEPVEESLQCGIPPVGWECSREMGHDGPCAAWPVWVNFKDHYPEHGQSIIAKNVQNSAWVEIFDKTLQLGYMTAWMPHTPGISLEKQMKGR